MGEGVANMPTAATGGTAFGHFGPNMHLITRGKVTTCHVGRVVAKYRENGSTKFWSKIEIYARVYISVFFILGRKTFGAKSDPLVPHSVRGHVLNCET